MGHSHVDSGHTHTDAGHSHRITDDTVTYKFYKIVANGETHWTGYYSSGGLGTKEAHGSLVAPPRVPRNQGP